MSSSKTSLKYKSTVYDIIKYNGIIEEEGFNQLFECINTKKTKEKCLLILTTMGGSPHISYKIARFLKNIYSEFNIIILDKCKSAGSLVAVGADNVLLDIHRGELGPLDVQIFQKTEDPLEQKQQSGLDLFQGFIPFKQDVLDFFINALISNLQNFRSIISVKNITDMSVNLTSSLFAPISSKLGMPEIGKYYRAILIARKYADMLHPTNLKEGGINKIIHEYPEHGFVIDYEEAQTIFQKVIKAQDFFDDKLLTKIYKLSKQEGIVFLDAEDLEGENNDEK